MKERFFFFLNDHCERIIHTETNNKKAKHFMLNKDTNKLCNLSLNFHISLNNREPRECNLKLLVVVWFRKNEIAFPVYHACFERKALNKCITILSIF